MRQLLIGTLALSLGCSHVPKSESAAPRIPAAASAERNIERSPLAMSSELNKVLVATIVDDRLLTYETCSVDIESLKTNGEIDRVINSGQVDCVNLNSIMFDAQNVMVVDAINREYVMNQRMLVKRIKNMDVFGSSVGAVAMAMLAANTGRWSYRAWAKDYATRGWRMSRGQTAEKVTLRTLGLLSGLLSVVAVGAMGAAANNAYAEAERTVPNTLERSAAEYLAVHKVNPKAAIPTGKELFLILVQAMGDATKDIDYKVRTL